MSELAVVAVFMVAAVLYNLKSIHIEFKHDQRQRRNKLLKKLKD
jgi:hypothetical protein